MHPDALTLTLIADKPFGERYFWEGQSNAAGEVFFATYPGGKVISMRTGFAGQLCAAATCAVHSATD